MRQWMLFVVFSVTFISAAVAQEHCADSDTPRECLRRLNLEAATNAAQLTAALAATGTSTPGTPARTALKDFLSVISSNLEGAVLSEDKDQSLVLGYDLPLHLPGTQLRPEVAFRKPTLSPAVEAAAGTSLPTFKDGLAAAHDAIFGLSLNMNTQHLGRTIAPHKALFDSMLTTLMASQGDAGLGGVPLANFDQPFQTSTPDPAARAALISAFETAARGSYPTTVATLTTDFGALLNNQPQLYASANYHDLKETSGPHSYSALVTFEFRSQNLNSFYRSEGRNCEATNSCVEAFERYIKRTRRAHQTGSLALTIEYNRLLPSSPKPPDSTVPLFVTPAQIGYVYAVTYGKPYASFLTGQEGRIDLSYVFDGKTTTKNIGTTQGSLRAASYVTFGSGLQSIAPPRDRFVATVMFTQKMTDRASLSLSVVSADHEETLPGACVGIVVSPSPGIVCKLPVTTKTRRTKVLTGITFKIPSVRRPKSGCCCPS